MGEILPLLSVNAYFCTANYLKNPLDWHTEMNIRGVFQGLKYTYVHLCVFYAFGGRTE